MLPSVIICHTVILCRVGISIAGGRAALESKVFPGAASALRAPAKCRGEPGHDACPQRRLPRSMARSYGHGPITSAAGRQRL